MHISWFQKNRISGSSIYIFDLRAYSTWVKISDGLRTEPELGAFLSAPGLHLLPNTGVNKGVVTSLP